MKLRTLVQLMFCAAPLAVCAQAPFAADRAVGALEVVARFDSGPIPTGVTVSQHGRIFINYPHWGDKVEATVAELVAGKPVPYPAGLPQAGSAAPSDRLLSVQSVVVDAKDRLWMLDTGRVEGAPAPYGGPKLIAVDLATNRVVQKIIFSAEVASPQSYLNDVRFDFTRGAAGLAYITDSSTPGIVVVDLASGRSWRHLAADASTHPDAHFQPYIEGEPLTVTGRDGKPHLPQVASDGIALGADHKFLYYCPLSSRHLYRVALDALADEKASEAKVAATVEDLGDKGMSDGMESDREGRIYFGDLETNSVRRRLPDGRYELLAHDPRILWADTFSLAHDGYLYFTANQLHRQPSYHAGSDLRAYPYLLFRIKVDGHPID